MASSHQTITAIISWTTEYENSIVLTRFIDLRKKYKVLIVHELQPHQVHKMTEYQKSKPHGRHQSTVAKMHKHGIIGIQRDRNIWN